MIIAITGGTGFVGSSLSLRHTKLGDEVRVLSRKIELKSKNVTHFFGDLSDPKINLSEFLNGVDILYHCAGEINDKSSMHKLHVDGTQRLVDKAIGNVGRWIQLSSVGVYGKYRKGVVTENSLEKPFGIYEQTKNKSDQIVINSGIPYVIVRPSNIFGKDMTNQSLKQLVQAVRKGRFFFIGKKNEFMVNYIHLDDVVSVLMLCNADKKAEGEIFILSQSISVKDMIKSFALDTQTIKNFLNLPEFLVRALVTIFEIVPKFPLTNSRIDALTNKCIYSSKKLHNTLKFDHSITLEERFKLFAKQK